MPSETRRVMTNIIKGVLCIISHTHQGSIKVTAFSNTPILAMEQAISSPWGDIKNGLIHAQVKENIHPVYQSVLRTNTFLLLSNHPSPIPTPSPPLQPPLHQKSKHYIYSIWVLLSAEKIHKYFLCPICTCTAFSRQQRDKHVKRHWK